MTAQPITRPTAGARHHTAADGRTGASLTVGATGAARPVPRPIRTEAGVRGRALLAAIGLALAAAVLPATAVHAAPQSPDVGNQFANPGGNPQPPEPPDPPQVGPEDLANPTENPEPPLPPDPPDVPDWGPDDIANPTENPEPPLPPEPPDNGPDDIANPTENPDPPVPPTTNPDSTDSDSIPTPQRVDAGFGGTAAGPHQAAGLALIAAALVLTALVIVIARRHRTESRSAR